MKNLTLIMNAANLSQPLEGNRLYGANVGDSRVYLDRGNFLTQLSLDHAMEEAGYENVLTQAIGIEEDVEPFYFENTIQKNDKILLCQVNLQTTTSLMTQQQSF